MDVSLLLIFYKMGFSDYAEQAKFNKPMLIAYSGCQVPTDITEIAL
jgi:hypothetical protein